MTGELERGEDGELEPSQGDGIDLVAMVPAHEPAEELLAFAGQQALGVIPVVGSIAADTLAHALQARQAQRQHDFDVAIAGALTRVLTTIHDAPAVEDIVNSDEFVAAVTRAQRAAAETASADKRRRLAAAVANGGSWAPFSASEREQFTRLAEEFSPLHIWLLHYFVDPERWMTARGLFAQFSHVTMGTVQRPLQTALGASGDLDDQWWEAVAQAAGDLERNGLGRIPLATMMSSDGIFESRTSDKGLRFLLFINEPASAEQDPPAL